MKYTPLEPAHGIITTLGGVAVVSEILNVDRTQVYRWTQPKERKGTDGHIPRWHHDPLIEWAREHRKPVTQASFYRSPSVPDSQPSITSLTLREKGARKRADKPHDSGPERIKLEA